MGKALSDLAKQELWQLFPIIVKPYNPEYAAWYRQARRALIHQLPGIPVFRINHIGSTALTGLAAKPIIDILLEVSAGCDWPRLIEKLKAAGWLLMSDVGLAAKQLVFLKGYTEQGFARQVFHLHVRPAGDWDELYFRDYLLLNPDVAKAYGQLKHSLEKPFRHDRDGYTEAKTDFILSQVKKAREVFGRRYSQGFST